MTIRQTFLCILILAAVVLPRQAQAAMRDCYYLEDGDYVCVRAGTPPPRQVEKEPLKKPDTRPRPALPTESAQTPFVPPAFLPDPDAHYQWPENFKCYDPGEKQYKALFEKEVQANASLAADANNGSFPSVMCDVVTPQPVTP